MNPWVALALALLVGYLLGSIPASYVAGRVLKGIDLREHGSGNLGATNVFRTLGWAAAIPVLLVDIGKGVLAVWIGLHLFPDVAGIPDLTALAAAIGAILGHSFSPFVGFKGGKGVATAAGAFGMLAPWAMIPAFLVWLILLLSTRIMSVASIAAAIVLPVNFVVYEVLTPDTPVRWASLTVTVLVGVWVVLRHRANLVRLREGTEKGLW